MYWVYGILPLDVIPFFFYKFCETSKQFTQNNKVPIKAVNFYCQKKILEKYAV